MDGELAGRVRVVLTTAPSAEIAERVAAALVGERLAACANVVPGVRSIFHWEGAVQTEAEVLVVLKTTDERVAALESRLVELHPYDVPEMLALPVEAGHTPYLAWVRDVVEGR